jgi:hypothetical protein
VPEFVYRLKRGYEIRPSITVNVQGVPSSQNQWMAPDSPRAQPGRF